MKKAVQYFSDEYLAQCRKMKPAQILRFLEDFRLLHGESNSKRRQLISIRIPEDLLSVFREKAALQGIPYQTQIQKLMREWSKE